MKKKGTSMVTIESAGAGDIVSMTGLSSPSIGYTVANVEVDFTINLFINYSYSVELYTLVIMIYELQFAGYNCIANN
jgi:predicted membrane GTPase involved in stress response